MPKYKLLRGIAHNLGDSFLSLMNYLKFDYCLDYLYTISRIEKTNVVEVDFLKCNLNPKCFNLRELINSVYSYKQDLNNRLIELGIKPIEVKSVKMKIKLDNKFNNINKSHKLYGNVFSEVLIKLKNGKVYSNAFYIKWLLDSDKNYKKLYDKIKKYEKTENL